MNQLAFHSIFQQEERSVIICAELVDYFNMLSGFILAQMIEFTYRLYAVFHPGCDDVFGTFAF